MPTILKVGSQGAAVRRLERELKERGFFTGKADGTFDKQTKAAVKAFEASKDWKTDGIVGGRIWRRLNLSGNGQDSFAIKTVNINVKNNPEMPQGKVRHDVRRAATQGSLIGWNEIGPDRYFKAIRNLGKEWGHYMPKHGNYRIPNPISWKKSEWELKGSGFMKTHGGMAKVSPARYITWAKLKHKDSDQTVVRINTHLVSGAWSGKKPTTEWRRKQWNTHMDKLSKLVERFEKQGHTVIVGGDFNRDSHKVLGNQVKYASGLNAPTHGNRTLDYLMHVQDDYIRKVGTKVDKQYHSDHNAVVVKYALKKEKK